MTVGLSLNEFAATHHDLSRMALSEPSADGFRRSWIMFMPEGTFKHPDYGKLDFSRKALAEYKKNFDDRVLKIDVGLDVNHDRGAAPGWVERLEFREASAAHPAGLWGLVRWTPLGVQLLESQQYRYFSPDLQPYVDERTGKRYEKVLRGGGLVNRPFLKELEAVTLSEWGSIRVSREGTERASRSGEGMQVDEEMDTQFDQETDELDTEMDADVEALLAEGDDDAETYGDEDDDTSDDTGDDGDEFDIESEDLDEDDEDAETFAAPPPPMNAGKGPMSKRGKKRPVPADDPEDAADGGDDEEEEMLDDEYAGQDGQDDSEDGEAAPPMRMGKKSAYGKGKAAMYAKGVKCSEPTYDAAWTLAEQRAIFAELAELKTREQKAAVRSQVAKWRKALGEGQALSKRFIDKYVRLMEQGTDGDGAIRLSEESGRMALSDLIETALLHGRVETGIRSSSYDMDSPEKKLAGVRLSYAEKREAKLELAAVELAERDSKNYATLTGQEKGHYQRLAEKALSAKSR